MHYNDLSITTVCILLMTTYQIVSKIITQYDSIPCYFQVGIRIYTKKFSFRIICNSLIYLEAIAHHMF